MVALVERIIVGKRAWVKLKRGDTVFEIEMDGAVYDRDPKKNESLAQRVDSSAPVGKISGDEVIGARMRFTYDTNDGELQFGDFVHRNGYTMIIGRFDALDDEEWFDAKMVIDEARDLLDRATFSIIAVDGKNYVISRGTIESI